MSQETLKVFGGEYPILKSFRDEFHLIAMPGGPTLAKSHGDPAGGMLSVIWCHDSDLVPQRIVREAIEWYVEKSWALVKEKLVSDDAHAGEPPALLTRAKNPREGDLFVNDRYYCRVEIVGDGMVVFITAIVGQSACVRNHISCGGWGNNVVSDIISHGARFIPVEAFEETPAAARRWKSCAIWPPGCCDEIGSYSDDTHPTQEAARGACDLLRKHGFGGDGKFFPVVAWVEPVEKQSGNQES